MWNYCDARFCCVWIVILNETCLQLSFLSLQWPQFTFGIMGRFLNLNEVIEGNSCNLSLPLLIKEMYPTGLKIQSAYIECEGWRRHSSLIFLILLFNKPNIEVSGWLYQTKTHFTHIVYQPFSRVSPPSFTLYGYIIGIVISCPTDFH